MLLEQLHCEFGRGQKFTAYIFKLCVYSSDVTKILSQSTKIQFLIHFKLIYVKFKPLKRDLDSYEIITRPIWLQTPSSNGFLKATEAISPRLLTHCPPISRKTEPILWHLTLFYYSDRKWKSNEKNKIWIKSHLKSEKDPTSVKIYYLLRRR